MHILFHILAFCGSLTVGCLILAFAGVSAAWAGGCVGGACSAGLFDAGEDAGINRGLPSGLVLGLLWAIYCMYTGGLVPAFLASLGLAVAMLIVAGLVALFFPAPPPVDNPDLSAYIGDLDSDGQE